jgi:hypothetical protein
MAAVLPSLPPDAIVPGPNMEGDSVQTPEQTAPAGTYTPLEFERDHFDSQRALRSPPLPAISTPDLADDPAPERIKAPKRKARSSALCVELSTESKLERSRDTVPLDRPAKHKPQVQQPQPEPRDSKVWAVLLPAAVVAGMIALGISLKAPAVPRIPSLSASTPAQDVSTPALPTGPSHDSSTTEALVNSVTTAPSATPSTQAFPSASTAASSGQLSREGPEEDLTLPVGSRIPKGAGLLEIRTRQPDAVVLLGGRELGTGPVVTAVLKPGQHTVLVRWRGKETAREVTVREARRTRFTLVPP